VGLLNGILVGIVRLNPLIVTLAVGQIVAAYTLRYARENTNSLAVPPALSSWAAEKPLGISVIFWTGAALTLVVALLLRYSAPGRRFQAVGANPQAAWMAGLHVRSHVVFAYTAAGTLYAIAGILLAGIRINVDPAFGAAYLLVPIAAVVIAGASLSGGLASATSTWVAALALTLLTQMLVILGLSTALQYIVYGAAIIAGMLISGDRVAALLGRVLRPSEASRGQREMGTNTS
jgi:ribose/xylose/arabinose/galactoside ABC-type transport system permease subunit